MTQIAPPIPYFGGKQKIASKITALFPEHSGYIEPFAGGLSVLFAKCPSRLEVVNDLNGHIVAFWRVLRDYPEALQRACDLTPHAREEFSLADLAEDVSDIERARRVWVLMTQGRSAIWASTGWRHYQDGAAPTAFEKYMSAYRDRMHPAAERLRTVQIEHRPAAEIIDSYGKHSANLLYVDPPYIGETRGSGQRYGVEMKSLEMHQEMLDLLRETKARVALSGYSHPLYEEELSDWQRVEISAKTQVSARREIVWMNYQPDGWL
ncbi:DNA adenine methylase [Leucobacter rhizosphaerae]|uniref:DNA adenine methylase n=1 Tax=Leucobacter rhizosphaerae TaxID=2932245 RepID=A0ABY4FVM9_9MICO|nr:DNA adenine methylase [Leucobacter rhizosphaerae]UOQ60363.1 DNA adenine methylase [Leucobacter rhizosphaerae]